VTLRIWAEGAVDIALWSDALIPLCLIEDGEGIVRGAVSASATTDLTGAAAAIG
jgi:hypothetical protein